jgi:hypothetical protein
VCLQLGDAELATVAMTGESTYKCSACAKELDSSSNDKTLAKSSESLSSHHEGATSSTSSNEDASSLMITVSTQLEAIRLNRKCTMQLVESLVDMVSNLTREVAHLKNYVLLKEEVINLHSIIEASPRLLSPCIPSEQRILPAEISHKDAASYQRVPKATPSTQALSAVPIPARTTLAELSYRNVAAAGISHPTALPEPDGFTTITHRKKIAISTPPAENIAAKVKPRRQPLIGVSSLISLPVIAKPVRSKALFVSRFSPKVTADDVHKTLKEQLSLKRLVCTKLKTKLNTYSSFHILVMEDDFSQINNTDVCPSGCLIAPYYGKLTPDQIFNLSTPEARAPVASINTVAEPAGNDGANGGSWTST